MLKKIFLFAILSPLAIQPVTKAITATEVAKNLVMPWSAGASEIKRINNATFNDCVELGTLGLTFGSMLYKTFSSQPRKFLTDKDATFALPYFLVVHELYSGIGKLINGDKSNKMKTALTAMALFAKLGLKGAPLWFGVLKKK